MTDDAYLFLVDSTEVTLGVQPTGVGGLACMDTPAVRAWLDAQGVDATSPLLRILPPEETAAVPEGAERLPVPLAEEELGRVRGQSALLAATDVEKELLAYRSLTDGREGLLQRALSAGVPAHRVAELSGEDLAAVKAAAG
ncbi:DUF6003 family protein [Streptomyces genisteinicus]|uniref:Uncharacterized protein n=1 Tax=Streptomyces genisteinicus TaxID=2768068 RepID=A0A7H0I191_9ACTN|nr:DUF6003 family protein [Streptomyces genisteinicus]QNP66557.1 hypothetical protein IAG43_28945 [Streptomyces genisteinicus]